VCTAALTIRLLVELLKVAKRSVGEYKIELDEIDLS
jgi:hypothetical protein